MTESPLIRIMQGHREKVIPNGKNQQKPNIYVCVSAPEISNNYSRHQWRWFSRPGYTFSLTRNFYGDAAASFKPQWTSLIVTRFYSIKVAQSSLSLPDSVLLRIILPCLRYSEESFLRAIAYKTEPLNYARPLESWTARLSCSLTS